MTATHRRGSPGSIVAGTLLIGIYLAIGAVQVGPRIMSGEAPVPERWSSTDKYLLTATGLESGSLEIIRTLERVPKGKTVAVFATQASYSSTLTAYIISYLAWPRPTQIVTMGGEGPKAEPLEQRAVGALFFCGMPPPPGLTKTEKLGSNLTFALLPSQDSPHRP